MALMRSVEDVLGYLEWARTFPKYALERRLDTFVALYLPAFLAHQFGAPVRHVAPEFPLRRPYDNRSTNVDFLLHRDGDTPAWLFVELKTDAASLDRKQLALYVEHARRGMRELLTDVERIHRASRQKGKYERLLSAVRSESELNRPVEVVCLAPPGVSTAPEEGVRFFGLDVLARWLPGEHRELWALLQPLLASLGAPPA